MHDIRREDVRARALRQAAEWSARRTFAADASPSARELAALARGTSISVVLPALNEAPTVAAICRSIRTNLIDDVPLVDELLVIDGGSTDDTVALASAAGARVVRARDVLGEIPFAGGKGESLWRSLSVARGDIVVWIDADIRNFEPHFVTRLVAPLLTDADIAFVKGFYRRPLVQGAHVVPDGGGRVTELTARPLLRALFPELAEIRQPLAGEYAGRRDVLERLPFFSGYSVEVGLLIDLLGATGLDAIAQADLTERVHRNRPLRELAPMAAAIARTIMRRAEELGRVAPLDDVVAGHAAGAREEPSELERPPLALLGASPDVLRRRRRRMAALP